MNDFFQLSIMYIEPLQLSLKIFLMLHYPKHVGGPMLTGSHFATTLPTYFTWEPLVRWALFKYNLCTLVD